MRPLRPLLLVAAVAIAAPLVVLASTSEVLLGTTPTRIPRTASTTSVLIFNAGPVAICCAQVSDGGAPPNCIPIASGTGLSMDIPSSQPVHCTAPTQQTADAGTRVLEVY